VIPRFLPLYQLRLLCHFLLSLQLRHRSGAEVALEDLSSLELLN
jgi:hypothetical protein